MSEMGEPGEETGSVRNFRYYSRAYLEGIGVDSLDSIRDENRVSRGIYRFNSNVGELWINLSDEANDRYQVVSILKKEEKKDGQGR